MLFSKHPKSIDSLLFKLSQADKLAQAAERQEAYDSGGSFFMIFSVQDVVEFKNDLHKLIRRLTTLCVLVTSCVAAGVAVWLIYVLRQ